MKSTITKVAAAIGMLSLAGCGGPDKLACDPSLPAGYTLSHEPPPPGFEAPTLMPPPCTPDATKKAADGTQPASPKPSNSAAVAGR